MAGTSLLLFPSKIRVGGRSDCFIENFRIPVALLWLVEAGVVLFRAEIRYFLREYEWGLLADPSPRY